MPPTASRSPTRKERKAKTEAAARAKALQAAEQGVNEKVKTNDAVDETPEAHHQEAEDQRKQVQSESSQKTNQEAENKRKQVQSESSKTTTQEKEAPGEAKDRPPRSEAPSASSRAPSESPTEPSEATQKGSNAKGKGSKPKGKGKGKGAEEKTKQTICKFWKQGHCRDGDDCTYAHGEDQLGQARRAS